MPKDNYVPDWVQDIKDTAGSSKPTPQKQQNPSHMNSVDDLGGLPEYLKAFSDIINEKGSVEGLKYIQGVDDKSLPDDLLVNFFQWYLQGKQTQEANEYNRSLQLDQRSYESPAAQLARLMQAGMSREAALQAIEGGQSQPTAATAPTNPDATPPSQSALNRIHGATAIIDSIFGAVSSAVSVGQFGVSLYNLKAQKALLQANASQAEAAATGLDAAGKLTGAVTSLVAPDGTPLTSDQLPPTFDNYDSLRNWVSGEGRSKNPNVAAFWNDNAGIENNLPFWDFMRQQYNARHDAKNQDELQKQNEIQTRIMYCNEVLGRVNISSCLLDLDFNEDTYQDRISTFHTQMLREQQGLVNDKTQGSVLEQTSRHISLENERQQMENEDYSNLRSIRNQANAAEFEYKLKHLTALSDPKLIRSEVKALKQDYRFQATCKYFDSIKYDYLRGVYNDDSNVRDAINLQWVLEQYGLTEQGTLGTLLHNIRMTFDTYKQPPTPPYSTRPRPRGR